MKLRELKVLTGLLIFVAICSCKPFYSVIRPVVRPAFKFIHFVNTPTACNYKNFDTILLKNNANLCAAKSVYSFYDTEDSLNWYTYVDKYIYEYKLSNDSISIIERISSKCSNDIRFVRYYKSGEIKEVKEYYYEVPIFIKKYTQNGSLIIDSIFFSDRQLSKLKKFIKSNLRCNPECKNYTVRNIYLDSKNLFVVIVVGHEVINKPGFNILKSPHLIYFLNSNTLELMKIEKINRNSNGDEFEYFGE